ncbi:hypothetical protein [Sphingomonas sp. MMS24-J13]|uniref:F0F1 ATP synthase subunit B family protein n=1 Tax=Sphingomonas sp. MMS24-J13 TaxID=3238686 RepID=UPI00384CC8A1
MRINWWTLALQTINVLVLVWLLSRFLYKPIVAAIAARQAAVDKLLADAETAKANATTQEAALKASNDAFAADVECRRAEAQASAEADRAKLLDQAKQEVADLHKQAEAAADEEGTRRGAALEAEAAVLAGQMAEKLLARLPAKAVTEAMFQALVDRLGKLSDEDRRRLASSPLQVITAKALGEDEARYGKALTAALPGLANPAFVVDPALIEGFELRNAELVLRNSWRADLDDLLHGLQEGETHVGIG